MKTQITHIGPEERISVQILQISKRMIGKYYEQLYTHKLNNLDEVGQFLENQKLPKLI